MMNAIRDFFTAFMWKPFGYKEIMGAEVIQLLKRSGVAHKREVERLRLERKQMNEESQKRLLNRGVK